MRLLICIFVTVGLISGSPILRENEVNEALGLQLYEGDIILDPDERPINGTLKYTAIIGKRWPNPVPFEFGPDMKHKSSGKKAIMAAIEQYHKYTCIRFKPRTTEKGYMRFDWAPGCASAVGFKPGKANKINLDSPCWHLGTIVHEMGHALGLWHEQSRPDREKYIKILWDNIAAQQEHNFIVHKDSDDLGTEYDLGSMMHYGTTEFSKDGSRTIKTLDYSKRLLMGQRAGFSDKDVKVLNLMYNCPAYRGTVPPKVCRDDPSANCAAEKKRGRCKNVSYETKMYRVCCKTCFGNVAGKLGEPKTWPGGPDPTRGPRTAEPTRGGPCVDRAPKSQCDYWARMGYCTSRSSAIRKMALDKCCATCKAHH